MNLKDMTFGQVVSHAMTAITTIVSIAILLLIAAMVVQKFGGRVPLVPALDHVAMAYVAGAWYLYRR